MEPWKLLKAVCCSLLQLSPPSSSRGYRRPEECAREWTPSPSWIVIEQSEASVKDTLRRSETARP
jgi:hypothetical protein